MKDKSSHIVQWIVSALCRILLAAAFTYSGFVKALDPLGFEYKLQDYLIAFGISEWIPSFFPFLGGMVLSGIEFAVGIFIFLGIRRSMASALALLLMLFMTTLTLYLALFNPVADCGCFGDAWVLSNWATFGKNVALLFAAIIVFRERRQQFCFVTRKMEWLVSLYTLFFIYTLSFYCLNHLPVLDFRPYKIGNNIWEGMQIPENAKGDVYEYTYVMKKDGVRKEFDLEHYPDSTWTLVETHSVLKEKGYEPPIHDFSLTDLETGEDVTESVLTDSGYTFFLVAHRVELADDSNIDLINEVYDYSVEQGYGFYCLTSSPEEEIEIWREKTGAEYPFCGVDDITLKTMIRSNPGLMLLKGGTILNKWSDVDIPDEFALIDRLENLPLGKPQIESKLYVIGWVCVWFVVPLLLIMGLDILFVRSREWRARHLKKKQNKEENINPIN